MPVFQDLQNRIDAKAASAAVIGLGYVGLPLAHSMCRKGLKVLGLDIDPPKIDALNAGKSYIDAVPSDAIASYISEGVLLPSTDFSRLADIDFIIICVPTPLDSDLKPDLSYVENTAKDIAKHLRKGHVVILESTTYPGTMNDVVKPILESSGLKTGIDFHLAYSPERENPGSTTHSTSTIPKIIGADDDEALALSLSFYKQFIGEMVPVSSMAVAEASKIMENVFRAVNIALVNELKVIFERMNIDVWEVIDAAKTKPFGFMPFYPGPGLGGHCIPIDPFYLSWKAEQMGVPTRFIELAGEINTHMPAHVVTKAKDALSKNGKDISGARVLVLGIAYKKNVADQRETPAFPIMDQLHDLGAEVSFYDPLIPTILPNRHHPQLSGKDSAELTPSDYDCVIIVTDHDEIDYDKVLSDAPLIIDTRNVFGKLRNEKVVKA